MLTPYLRGETWWVKGRVEVNGRPVSAYVRESTGSSTESGARDWIRLREEQEERRFYIGDEGEQITFMGAVLLYNPTADMGKYLEPLLRELGHYPCAKITPKMVKDLGAKLYPKNCTDSWRRWVVTPVRAVINNAHELGRCPPIKIKGYDKEERLKQDKRRGKRSREAKTPGSWEWLLKFRQHSTSPYRRAMAHMMFVTGRRVGQMVVLHPDDLDLDNARARVIGVKGHDDEWVDLTPELVAELRALKPKRPRGWERDTKDTLRVFGYADRCSMLKGWRADCKRAGIPYLPPHSAGRHGFGQEMVVRQGVDAQAAASFGAWADTSMLSKTYTHPEDVSGKIHRANRTGLVQAEKRTGLKLLEKQG
jgi:integrase